MYLYFLGELFLAVLFNVMVVAAEDHCPEGWLIGCSCLVVKSSPRGLTWNETAEDCTLGSLNSRNETETLGEKFRGEIWIGVKADANSSFFTSNGKPAPYLSPEIKQNPENRTCIAIQTTQVWKATPCSEKYRFVCERPKNESGCSNGWTPLKDHGCYRLSEAAMNFANAQKNCTAMNAKLAEISRTDQYPHIRKSLYDKNKSMHAWLGLRRVSNTTAYTYTSSGSEPNYTFLGVEFKPEPKKDCVSMELNNNDVVWKEKQCEEKLHAYICQTRIQTGLNFRITNVNETSANISWSVRPANQCGPSNITITLSKGGNTLANETKINNGDNWWLVHDLWPEKQYNVQFTGSNLKGRLKREFQTTKIRNPLHLLKNISSTSLHAGIGGNVILLCAAEGEPPITFTWEKDKKKLPSYMVMGHPYRSSILQVMLTNQTTYGEYVCHVQDRFGKINYTVVINGIQKDVSEDGNHNIFVAIIVCLAAAVAICLMIVICCVRHVKVLKQKLNETKKVDNITLTSVSNEAKIHDKQDIPQAPSKAVNEYDVHVSPVDETETYTALNRQGVDEEDNFYSPLNEQPLYENAHILPDKA